MYNMKDEMSVVPKYSELRIKMIEPYREAYSGAYIYAPHLPALQYTTTLHAIYRHHPHYNNISKSPQIMIILYKRQ